MNPFRAALDGWNEQHWIKGRARDNLGGFCAAGRLDLVRRTIEDHILLDDVAREMFPDRMNSWGCVASVNDDPHTTFADVQQIFEKAAVRWDEQV